MKSNWIVICAGVSALWVLSSPAAFAQAVSNAQIHGEVSAVSYTHLTLPTILRV